MRSKRLITAAILVAAATLAVSIASSSPAEACSPVMTQVLLEAVAPATGQDDVPLAAAVVATLELTTDGGASAEPIAWMDYHQTFTIELADADGDPVAGQTLKSFPDFERQPISEVVTLAFQPDAPLVPETTYRRTIVMDDAGEQEVVYEDTFTTASADATHATASWSGDVTVDYTETVSEITECCSVDTGNSCGDEYCEVVSYDYSPILIFSFDAGTHPLGRGALSYEVERLHYPEHEPVIEVVSVGPPGRPFGEEQISVTVPASATVDDCYWVVARDAATDEFVFMSIEVCVTPDDLEPIERLDESELGLECGDVDGGGGEVGGGTGGEVGGGGQTGGDGGGQTGGDGGGQNGGGCSTTPSHPSPLSMLILLGMAALGLNRRLTSKG